MEIKYHSLAFEDPADEAEFLDMVNNTTPGEDITLHKPPTTVNVELFADFPGYSEE